MTSLATLQVTAHRRPASHIGPVLCWPTNESPRANRARVCPASRWQCPGFGSARLFFTLSSMMESSALSAGSGTITTSLNPALSPVFSCRVQCGKFLSYRR